MNANTYLKAQYEQFQQGIDKLKGLSADQLQKKRYDAFNTAQAANQQRKLASDPNASKGLDPFTKSEMLNAPNKLAIDTWMDLHTNDTWMDMHTNMDDYAAAADKRRSRNQAPGAGTATVNYTNPGTAGIASPTAPTLRKTTPRPNATPRTMY